MNERQSVRLVGTPAGLYLAHLSAVDDLLHELRTMRIGDLSGTAPVHGRLRELMHRVLDEDHRRWGAVREQARRSLDGQCGERLTLALTLAGGDAGAAPMMYDLVEEIEAYSAKGLLLALPASGEVWALRRWMRDEVVAQGQKGEPPTPFPDRTGRAGPGAG